MGAALPGPLTSPPVLAAVAAAWVYWRGYRVPLRVVGRPAGQPVGRRSQALRERRWRALAFAAGLATIVAALTGPLDTLSERWFWVHMTQHLLLVMVAAPLLVLGAPWLAPWRVIGHRARVRLTRTVRHSPGWAPARATFRLLVRPIPAWLAFNVTLLAWHLPALYDLAVRDAPVHYLEHGLLLLTAVLFWTQVIDSPPLARRLAPLHRVGYLTSAAIAGWLLALALALPASPVYPAYAAQHPGSHRAAALTDQQVAAGVMWVPGSVPYSIGVFYALYRWMDDAEATARSRTARSRARLVGHAR